MATSGNTSWELASTALVTAAYRKLGYLALGQTLDATSLAQGVEQLNAIIALLNVKGMPLWKRTTVALTLSATSQVYTLANAEKVAQVVLTDTQGTNYPLIEKSLYDFNRLPTNGGPGVPIHYTFTPSIQGGILSIWPLLSDTSSITYKGLSVVYQKEFDGMFSATDTIDFPSFWTMGIIYKLALALSPETGLPLQDRQMLKAEADEAIKMASDYGDEDGSLYISPTRFPT